MRRFFVIAILLLVITIPASAYTLLEDYTLYETGSTAQFNVLRTNSTQNMRYNITRMEWSGNCLPSAGFVNGFSIPDLYTSGASHFGNMSFSYSNEGLGLNKKQSCNIEMNFWNFGGGENVTPYGVTMYHLNNNSVFYGPALYYANDTAVYPGVNRITFAHSSPHYAGHYRTYGGSAMSIPISDFNGTPLVGAAPQLITLTDQSTGGSLAYNWSGSGPGTMWWGPANTQNTSVYLSTPGNYTITHGVENAMGSDIETKTDYIWIYDDNATVTTEFVTIDAIGGAAILNASVSLRDVENSTWTNSSTNAMGSAYITTLVGHTINAYASAIGFKDNDLLGVEAAGPPQGYAILMQPKGYFNVSEGYVTLYVSVFDDGTSEPISGASVTVAKSNGMAELWQTTNAAGIATFPVENETDFIAQASKAGYSTASKGVNSGTGSGGDATVSVNIWLAKGTVTPTTTMTAGPGGTVPVTQDPYLSLSPEEKQSALATDVMNYGPMLVNFFILLTIVGGFKMITK